MLWKVFLTLCFFCQCYANRLLDLNTVEDFMNICLDGISHKTTPGPESQLFQQVSTVRQINSDALALRWSLSQVKKEMPPLIILCNN